MVVEIYTDGACKGNPGRGGWGAWLSSAGHEKELFGGEDSRRLRVTVLSFGFKYGLPPDADFVADVRFLPNPYWVPDLR